MPYVRKNRSRTLRARKTTRTRVSKKPRTVGKLYRGSRITRSPKALRVKWANPISRTATYKLRYADDAFDMSTTAVGGYITAYHFSGNSPYDPDSTGVGVQPYGYDSVLSATAFPYYQAYASSISVKLYSANALFNGVVSLVPMRGSAPTYRDRSDLVVIPGSKQAVINTQRSNIVLLKAYATTMQMCKGFAKEEGSFSAAYNANPATRWFWHVYLDTTGVAVEAPAYMDVRITYYAKCFRIDDDNES